MLTRDALLAARSPVEAVAVPGLDDPVHVRVMTAGERDRFEAHQSRDPHTNFRGRLLLACVCDPDGKPAFTEADLPALAELPSTVAEVLVDAIIRTSKLRPDDVEAARKNSESGPSSDSGAASPSPSAARSRSSTPRSAATSS